MAKRIVVMAVFLGAGLSASAAPVDLSTWSARTLDFPGAQPAGSWVLATDSSFVDQVINADPSFYLNNRNQTSYSTQGSWQVLSGAGDNDYMGFVFGYQNSSNFYLFDWKAGRQGYAGGTAAEGMTIKKMTGATGDGLVDLSLGELWENENDLGDMQVLAQNHGSTEGWTLGTPYDFLLEFNQNPNELRVVVEEDESVLWDVTVVDDTFTSGQFGFYNFSQGNVRYAGFEQEGGVIVDPSPVIPAPSAMLLVGIGSCLTGWIRRRNAV